MEGTYNVGLTYGVFDLLHVGHTRYLQQCKGRANKLIVGVLSDEVIEAYKRRPTIYPCEQRVELVASLKCVDEVFVHEGPFDGEGRVKIRGEKIRDVLSRQADVVFKGDDWKDDYDFLKPYAEVIYLPRTEGISSSEILAKCRSRLIL